MRPDVLKMNNFRVEFINSVVEVLKLAVIGCLSLLQSIVEIVSHKFEILIVLVLDLNETQLIFVT